MANENLDQPVRKHIEELVKEEHRLREAKSLASPDHRRLEAIQVELDQCWDLLRQRRALREFGDDPDHARVRPKNVVENYEQ
jgi:uncharacterized protein DUF2630